MSYKKKGHTVIITFEQSEVPAMVIPVDTSQKTLLGTYDSSRVQLEYTGDQLDYSYTDLGEQFQMLRDVKQQTKSLESNLDQFKQEEEYLANWNTQQQSNEIEIKTNPEPGGK